VTAAAAAAAAASSTMPSVCMLAGKEASIFYGYGRFRLPIRVTKSALLYGGMKEKRGKRSGGKTGRGSGDKKVVLMVVKKVIVRIEKKL
jgi:hypothetical protein